MDYQAQLFTAAQREELLAVDGDFLCVAFHGLTAVDSRKLRGRGSAPW
jgi:hypothetical protein